jgi:hypothetical protein
MAVATQFLIRLAVPLLVGAAVVHLARMQTSGAGPFTPSWEARGAFRALRALPASASHDGAARLEARTRLAEPARPLILDGVLYLGNAPRAGERGAAETPWEFGIVQRRVNPPRYY